MKSKPIVQKLKAKIQKEFSQIKLTNFSIPLTNGEDCGKLKDILEEKVDEKYYVDPKRYNNLDIQEIIDSKFERK